MNVQLNLFKSVIIEAVKAETYIKGIADRSADERMTGIAYVETAGDETLHERKLMRGLYSSLDKFKLILSEYLEDDSHDNVNNSVNYNISGDAIVFTLTVPDNFRSANKDVLARICSKFIEDNILVLWWGTINPKQAEFYTTMLNEDIYLIKKTFEKGAPNAAQTPYTSSVTLAASSVTIDVNDPTTITYTLSSGAIDDINARCDNPRILKCFRQNGVFKIEGLAPGSAIVTLFSIHDESKNATLYVTVNGEPQTF